MFGGFPSSSNRSADGGYDLQVNKPYKMSATIRPTGAEYSIDGAFYASANYSESDVP
jgi:hypothetical protein